MQYRLLQTNKAKDLLTKKNSDQYDFALSPLEGSFWIKNISACALKSKSVKQNSDSNRV